MKHDIKLQTSDIKPAVIKPYETPGCKTLKKEDTRYRIGGIPHSLVAARNRGRRIFNLACYIPFCIPAPFSPLPHSPNPPTPYPFHAPTPVPTHSMHSKTTRNEMWARRAGASMICWGGKVTEPYSGYAWEPLCLQQWACNCTMHITHMRPPYSGPQIMQFTIVGSQISSHTCLFIQRIARSLPG